MDKHVGSLLKITTTSGEVYQGIVQNIVVDEKKVVLKKGFPFLFFIKIVANKFLKKKLFSLKFEAQIVLFLNCNCFNKIICHLILK